jgi:hypothetical protein
MAFGECVPRKLAEQKESRMREPITETTDKTVGVRVNPHLFRTAGVTTLATRATGMGLSMRSELSPLLA